MASFAISPVLVEIICGIGKLGSELNFQRAFPVVLSQKAMRLVEGFDASTVTGWLVWHGQRRFTGVEAKRMSKLLIW
jgi:hypothetical protein